MFFNWEFGGENGKLRLTHETTTLESVRTNSDTWTSIWYLVWMDGQSVFEHLFGPCPLTTLLLHRLHGADQSTLQLRLKQTEVWLKYTWLNHFSVCPMTIPPSQIVFIIFHAIEPVSFKITWNGLIYHLYENKSNVQWNKKNIRIGFLKWNFYLVNILVELHFKLTTGVSSDFISAMQRSIVAKCWQILILNCTSTLSLWRKSLMKSW